MARTRWKEKHTNLEAEAKAQKATIDREIIPLLNKVKEFLKNAKEEQDKASQVNTQLQETLNNATQIVTEIQGHQNSAKKSAEDTQTNQDKAREIVTEIEKQVGQINAIIGEQAKRQEKQNEGYKNLMEKILTFYEGEKQEDGTRSGGMRNKIEETFEKAEEIEGERTGRALSESFKIQAETHKKRTEQFQKIYWRILGALLVAVLIPVGLISFYNSPAWILVPFIAVTAALIYVLWHQAKKNSEENRLYAEYAHKSALAKTYRAYSQEASKNKELELMLLMELLNAIKKNPSEGLRYKSDDQTFLKEEEEEEEEHEG